MLGLASQAHAGSTAPVEVFKSADRDVVTTWQWTLAKTADIKDVTVLPGQLFTVNYQLELTAKALAPEATRVHGSVEIFNRGTSSVTITGVDSGADGDSTWTIAVRVLDPNRIPEPATAALGLLGTGRVRRRCAR